MSSILPEPCEICGKARCSVTLFPKGNREYDVFYQGDCLCCGKTSFHQSLLIKQKEENLFPPHVFLGYLRNRSILDEYNGTTQDIRSVDELRIGIVEPRTPIDKVNLILRYFFYKQKHYADYISINTKNDYTICFAKDDKEFTHLLIYCHKEGLIEGEARKIFTKTTEGLVFIQQGRKLTMDGWETAYEVCEKLPDSKQAFVAIKFDEEKKYLEVYHNAIYPALEQCGYDPYLSYYEEHNENITDKIIAGIRKSGIMVADVTGASQNVYYEAGFSKGLGIPVILCCKKTDKENMKFDTNHIKHIIWEDFEDYKEKLVNRIEATGLSKKL